MEDQKGAGNVEMWDYNHFWMEARSILASMDGRVLETLCWGNMSRKRRHDEGLRKELSENERREEKEPLPAVYLLEFVRMGTQKAPTPNELLAILRVADRYVEGVVEDLPLIHGIDQVAGTWTIEKTRGGERRYMNTLTQVTKYRVLQDKMRALFRDMDPEEKDRTLEQPLRQLGYTKDSEGRPTSYKNHDTGNSLIGLLDAITGVVWPGKFDIQRHVIYPIFEATAAGPSELVLRSIGSADIKTGMGLCHEPAGQTDTSA